MTTVNAQFNLVIEVNIPFGDDISLPEIEEHLESMGAEEVCGHPNAVPTDCDFVDYDIER